MWIRRIRIRNTIIFCYLINVLGGGGLLGGLLGQV